MQCGRSKRNLIPQSIETNVEFKNQTPRSRKQFNKFYTWVHISLTWGLDRLLIKLSANLTQHVLKRLLEPCHAAPR